MVQLNTSYDSQLKGKIFVLKGEEAYAKTTDTVAELISDYDDCNSHMRYTRVGLQIKVLRAEGDGYVTIFVDGVPQDLVIPYNPQKMNQIIDEDYHDKGVWWIDGALVIGESDNSDTGYFLSYDEEHSIVVEYSGNKKCLGSKSETITFEHTKPQEFKTNISLEGTPTYVDSAFATHTATIPLTVTLESSQLVTHELKNAYATVDGVKFPFTAYPNTETTVSLTSIKEGLQTVTVTFEGDDEMTSDEETMDISVGSKVEIIQSPSMLVGGSQLAYSVSVKDYFGNPVADGETVVPYYCQTHEETTSGGTVLMELNQSEYVNMMGANPNIDPSMIDLTVMYVASETAKYTNTPVDSADVVTCRYETNVNGTIDLADGIFGDSKLTPITFRVTDSSDNPLPNYTFRFYIGGVLNTRTTDSNGLAVYNYVGTGCGSVSIQCSEFDISETIIDYNRYWSRSNPSLEIGYNPSLYESQLKKYSTYYEWTIVNNYHGDMILSLPNTDKYRIEVDITSIVSSSSIRINHRGGLDEIYLNGGSVLSVVKEYSQSENKTYFTISNGTEEATDVQTGNVNTMGIVLKGSDGQGIRFNKLRGRIIE